MDVDALLHSAHLPNVSVSTDDALARTLRRGRTRRHRRMTLVGVGTVLVVVGLVATTLSVVRGDDPQRLATGPSGAEAAGSWRPLAASPLAPRDQGIAAWTGSEVVVVGGSSTIPCPANADCLVALEPLADGAAYNPASDTWRSVRDAPVAFVSGLAVWTGTEVLVLAHGRGAADVLLAYDPAADAWSRRADPPQSGFRAMAWTGESWVGAGPSADSGGRDWRYVSATDRWEQLPTDPLGPVSDRTIVWTGHELVLVGSDYGEEGTANGLYEAAALDADGAWRRLPASTIANNGGTWTAIDGLVVNPTTNSVGRDVSYDTGGMLQVDTGQWHPLPQPPEAVIGGRTGFHGRADRWLVDDDRLLDPVSGTWHTVEDRSGEAVPAVAAWTGTELVTWGGTVQHDSDWPELVADGYAYRPPGQAVSTEVALTDASYECGPTDAPVVSFRAASNEALTGVAELVVLDDVFGSSRPIDIEPAPRAFTLTVRLTHEAYEAGEGELRIRSVADDAVLGATSVRLRLSGGGCG